uniref:Uncharacterized protein n=1 Tax=Fagus sylvatica TaxID=28930 RepID=A0A2N9IPU0_FAGSY
MLSIQYPFFHYHKNGYGVSHGVGARRIVSEWPELDFEARGFTAKILGDEVELQEPSSNQSQISTGSSEVDSESKAEL